MKKFLTIVRLLAITLLLMPYYAGGYGQPAVNLGASNFLDGGPLRPKPGWYFGACSKYYYANRFLDREGKPLTGESLSYNNLSITPGVAYQTNRDSFMKGKWGASAALPLLAMSRLGPNSLGLKDSGAGFGDLIAGLFLQWGTVMRKTGKPFFVNRIEFDAFFPTGKYHTNEHSPGSGLFSIDPYWAATFYFTHHWAISWRLHYLWSSQDKKRFQPGQAVHGNFDMEYEMVKHLWVGVAGYFFEQISNSKLGQRELPDTCERVVAVGPGALYAFSHDLYFASSLFFETSVRNRPLGTSFIARFLMHF